MDPQRPRRLGDVEVGPIGLGAMPLSLTGRPSRDDAARVIAAAVEAGVTLIDTADAYCLNRLDTGHNERLIGAVLSTLGTLASDVMVATKGGHVRGDDGSWQLDGRPEHLHEACRQSLRRLGVECIDLYQLHRPDPRVPYAESVGALAELRDQGLIRLAGISNASPAQIREAAAIVPLAAVQNELSPFFTTSLPEVACCAELGLAFLAWSPLGGGRRAGSLGDELPAIRAVADRHGVSPAQVVLAWELSIDEVVIPIPGARRIETLTDSQAASTLALTDADLDELNLLVAA